jgi:dTDP-4-dehydrorhamnose 3,5-epimerase
MIKNETEIFGAFIIEPDVFTDHRGLFFETYNYEKFVALGIEDNFLQDNFSASKQGVLRGLHFQFPPKPMAKLVRCGRGRLFDVAVDMRQDSPTFKKWFGVELSAENKKMFYIPAGCAHGFYALEDCELLYKCSNVFQKELDAGFRWNDPEIGIVWPLIGEPVISERDAAQPNFSEIVVRANS